MRQMDILWTLIRLLMVAAIIIMIGMQSPVFGAALALLFFFIWKTS